jgi:hypothetical protein
MMKLPARPDGQWTVRQNSDKLPDLIATRNLTFDKEGYLRLSKPTVAIFTSSDDADLGRPVKFARQSSNFYWVLTQNKQFAVDFRQGRISVVKDSLANVPIGDDARSYAEMFNSTVAFAEGTDIHTLNLNALEWTDIAVTLNGTGKHPMCAVTSLNTLAVADTRNTIVQFSSSGFSSGGSTLTIPVGYRVVSMAYNNNLIGLVALDGMFNDNGMFFVWDGVTTAANYAVPLNTNTGTTVIPYKNSFVVFTGVGQLLFWDGKGLVDLAQFPSYYTDGYIAALDGSSCASSYFVDGGIFLLNMSGGLAEEDEFGRLFLPTQSGGTWCYDSAVGLYHRHATTGNKVQNESLVAGSVTTADSEITVSSAPETGTPVYYYSGGDTAIGGLTDGSLYYTIKVDATTVQLAETYADAIAGNEITLTSNISADSVPTANVSTANDTIVLQNPLPTFAPWQVTYSNGGGTSITGLTDNTTYWARITSGSTASLYATWANAIALASKIDLTGTGNDAQTFDAKRHTLTFIPKTDFGQSFSPVLQADGLESAQGGIDVFERFTDEFSTSSIFGGYLFGARVASNTTTEVYSICTNLKNTENRGYFVTSKFMSQGLQDTWQKLYIKHNNLKGDFDKIIVKYRTLEKDIVQIGYTTKRNIGQVITWTTSNTFTTTDTQYADVLAGDEVEVVQGAGSGYLLHVSSITETGGTYTVVLDESVKNIVATDTGRAVVSRWTLAKVLDGTTPQNEDGYSEISIGKNSKSIQFKIELRGEDVEIEELLIAHEPFKKVV